MIYKTTLETYQWPGSYYHFPIDKDTTELLSSDGHKRVICKVNGQVKMHSGLMPSGQGSYIMVNKNIREKLGIKEGDEVTLELEKDTSEYGMPMPESLQVMLDQDEVGSKYFHALTPGKQRSLIHLVAKVKNIDKQINKSLAIIEHLKEVQGRINSELLMAKIKEYNQMDRFH